MKKGKFHYAWLVLLGVILIRGFSGGGISLTSGLFLSPITAEIGVGIGQLSLYFSITSIVMVLWLPTCGKLMNKLDIRWMVLAGAALHALSFAAFGLMNSVYGWYVLAIPHAMGATILVNLMGPILINRWFSKNEGTILGIQMAFVSLFGAVLQPLTSRLIVQSGWRSAYYILGGVTFVVTVLSALLLLRNKPEDKNLRPYGDEKPSVQRVSPKKETLVPEIPEKTALRSASFYLLLLFMVAITGVAVFTQHIPTYGALMGYPIESIGTALAFASIGSAIGSIAIGVISDRLGCLKTCYGVIFIGMVACGGFLLSHNGFFIFGLSTFLHGLMNSSIMVLAPILVLSFYGQRDYEKIYAKISMGAPLASILFIPAYGFLYDLLKNYTFVLLGMVTLLLLSGICIAIGWRKRCTIDGCPGWGKTKAGES